MLRLKRVYESPAQADGHRILVDRLWPRGVRKQDAELDEWMREIAPSPELRRWYGHDPKKWPEFQRRYRQELRARDDLVRAVAERASTGTVTLVFAARDEAHSHAAVLAAVLRPRVGRARSAARKEAPARPARLRRGTGDWKGSRRRPAGVA